MFEPMSTAASDAYMHTTHACVLARTHTLTATYCFAHTRTDDVHHMQSDFYVDGQVRQVAGTGVSASAAALGVAYSKAVRAGQDKVRMVHALSP